MSTDISCCSAIFMGQLSACSALGSSGLSPWYANCFAKIFFQIPQPPAKQAWASSTLALSAPSSVISSPLSLTRLDLNEESYCPPVLPTAPRLLPFRFRGQWLQFCLNLGSVLQAGPSQSLLVLWIPDSLAVLLSPDTS